MLQKLLVTAAFIVLLLSPGGAARAAAPAKDYSADRFDAQIVMQQDGSLIVTETVVFRFVGGPFTHVFRDIPTDYTDGITVLSTSMDNQPQGSGAASVQIDTSSNSQVEVTWFFDPTSDQAHTFVLRYRVQGVVQKTANADALYWNALPTSYEYAIRSSTITVSYPEKASLLAPPEVRQGSAQVSTSPNQAVFSASNLDPDTPLEIGLRFRPGSVIATAPLWQQVQERTAALTVPSLVGGPLFFLLGTFGFVWYYRRPRRRIPITRSATSLLEEPPGALSPAIASALVNPGNAADWHSALGTLFALAARGVLRISDKKLHGAGDQAPDFSIQRQSMPEDLRPYELGLLQILFPARKATSILVSHIGPLYTGHAEWFTAPVKQELLDMGLLDARRQRIRSRLGGLAWLVLLIALPAGVLSLLFGIPTGTWPLVSLALGLLLSCIVGLILRAKYSLLSDQGAQAAADWQAFSRYLRTPWRGQAERPDPALFARYLPYAAAFDLPNRWTQYFQKQGVAAPPWFHSLANASTDPESMESFVSMVTATNIAGQRIAPTSSTSSHISGGSFGGGSFGGGSSGGAAGGGSSGAG
ncbi:MAG: DUF2207 domain-containing protein [Ktedonobacteraceae bacterium]